MQCPRCGATNPETAQFCNQCYTRFDALVADDAPTLPVRGAEPDHIDPAGPHGAAPHGEPPRTGDDPPAMPGGSSPLAEPTPAGTEPAGTEPAAGEDVGDAQAATPTVPVTAGRFHASGGDVGWACAVCGADNSLTTFTCTVCGARMDAEPRDRADQHDWARARRSEILLPGWGYLQVGSTGMGIARAAMVVLWLGAALLLASGGTAGLVTAIPPIVGVATIWVLGPGDLTTLSRGRTPRLDARRFAQLVAAVTVGVIVLGGLGILLG